MKTMTTNAGAAPQANAKSTLPLAIWKTMPSEGMERKVWLGERKSKSTTVQLFMMQHHQCTAFKNTL
jgi:hypothetical protein